MDTPERLLAKLETRTRRELDMLHFVESGEGFHCLDVNLRAQTLTDLRSAVQLLVEALPADTVLPAAPEEYWRAMFGGQRQWIRALRELVSPSSGNHVHAILVRL